MSKVLHVVSLDVPSPPSYGGVIDIYYRLKTLTELGAKIHLHCFQYGRKPITNPSPLCEQIYYYPRRTGLCSALTRKPYITYSRRSSELLQNLLAIDAPILFEGIHCCQYLNHPGLKERKKLVRCHNIEHTYYYHLAKASKKPIEKVYFAIESMRLRRFEPILRYASSLLAISPKECQYFRKRYPEVETLWLSAFHGLDFSQEVCTASAPFFLFHGNLAVAENERAALELIPLAKDLQAPLIIAGSNPSRKLKKASLIANVSLEENPSKERMDSLIAEATAHLLVTHQATGVKLKLLHALYRGRAVICNPQMVLGTGLENATIVVNSPLELVEKANLLLVDSASAVPKDFRERLLKPHYSDLENGKRLLNLI